MGESSHKVQASRYLLLSKSALNSMASVNHRQKTTPQVSISTGEQTNLVSLNGRELSSVFVSHMVEGGRESPYSVLYSLCILII